MKQTILITGASSGFGKEAAQLFQQKGWNVIATMRNPDKEQVLTQLPNVLVLALDVTQPDSIQAAVVEGIRHFGAIDVLLNNAGYGLIGVFESSTPEQVQQQYATNVFGLMDVTRVVLPYMREKRKGVIINLSSVGGFVGMPFGSFYNSSKFAVEGFSEGLYYELAPFGISVKIVEPGSVATNFRQGLTFIKNAIPDYDPLLGSLFQCYTKPTEHLTKASPAEVAETIYTAATDGAVNMRYVVGADAAFFIDLKRNNPDAAFVEQMRAYFVG